MQKRLSNWLLFLSVLLTGCGGTVVVSEPLTQVPPEFGKVAITGGKGVLLVLLTDPEQTRPLSGFYVMLRTQKKIRIKLTDSKGKAVFEDVTPGKCRLTVLPEGSGLARTVTIQPDKAVLCRCIPRHLGSIKGTVTGIKGELLGNAQILLGVRCEFEIASIEVTSTVKCDESGTFSADLFPGRYNPVCQHAQYVPARQPAFSIWGSQKRVLKLKMDRLGGGFRIQPVGPDDRKIATGTFRVYGPSGKKVKEGRFNLSKDRDAFAVMGLPRGQEYSVAVFTSRYLPAELTGLEATAFKSLHLHDAVLKSPKYRPAEQNGTRLEYVNGLPVLHVYGSGRELGKQIGKMLQDRMRQLVKYEMAELIPREHKSRIDRIVADNTKHIPQRFLDEISGMAEAAGVDYKTLLAGHVMVELMQMSCTAIAVDGRRSSDSKLLFGRNVDFEVGEIARLSSLITVYHVPGYKSFLSVNWPGMVGVASGMNEDGLCVANLLAHGISLPHRGTPYLFLMRRALEECGSVDEAIQLFKKSKRTVPHNIFLADAEDAVVLECTPSDVRVRRLKDGLLFCSNFFAGKSKRPADKCPRYRKMGEMTKRPASLSRRDIQHVLKEVALEDINIQSMVFVPSSRTVYVSLAGTPAAAGPFLEIDGRTLMQRVGKTAETKGSRMK